MNVTKKSIVIFAMLGIVFMTIVYFSFNDFKLSDNFLKVAIYPSSGLSETYFYRFSESGIMYCESGTRIGDDMTVEKFIHKKIGKDKLAYEQRKVRLSEDELNRIKLYLTSFDENIYEEKYPITYDSWEVQILYNERIYKQDYYALSSEVRKFIDYIINLSPIKVELRGFA